LQSVKNWVVWGVRVTQGHRQIATVR